MPRKFRKLERALGHRFQDRALLERALTHSSAKAPRRPSNERLEFLGDAVVGLIVSEQVFALRPRLTEGEMTGAKSAAVNRRAMARAAQTLGLPEFLVVDEGLRQRRRYPTSMLANVYEAAVGAIYLDGGLPAAQRFVSATLGPELARARAGKGKPNCKSILQERAQSGGEGVPRYRVVESVGAHHERRYVSVVTVGGRECGSGRGTTKKDAEQEAARNALDSRYPGWADG